ncbi:MAG: LacI family DNA-binding transcriptional regulator [Collinsella bouchesdurhonensis]|nr:LacI family DNA-binding transcriptional regulator [Collinsella bouchesdurhonensis]
MTGSKKITIAHVAEHAKVSSATVSRVLRHPELVNPSTVARVRKSLSELGYSGIAGQPAAGTSRRTIVVNIPWLDNPFYGEIMRGVRVSAEAHGLEMLISWGSPDNVESCKRFCSMLQNCGAAGVIILCPLSSESLERISSTVPTVQCCEYNPETNIPFVSIDDREAARTAVEHLVSCGCKKLSIVCGPQVYKYARGRKEGFLEVIRMHDLVERPSWMLQIPNNNFGLAYSAICHMLESPNRPDGVFACSDTYAAAVIRAAKKCGLEVPRDLMVVGFDNTDTATMTTPALTTISQPRYDMGFSACNLLIERMDGSDSASSMLLETELVVRESTIRK